MPEIIVRSDDPKERDAEIHLRERVTSENLRSGHYADQLVERIGWAVVDATEAQDEEKTGAAS